LRQSPPATATAAAPVMPETVASPDVYTVFGLMPVRAVNENAFGVTSADWSTSRSPLSITEVGSGSPMPRTNRRLFVAA
jgi:hypothetical protein